MEKKGNEKKIEPTSVVSSERLPAPSHLKKGTSGPFLMKKGTLRDKFSITIGTN